MDTPSSIVYVMIGLVINDMIAAHDESAVSTIAAINYMLLPSMNIISNGIISINTINIII